MLSPAFLRVLEQERNKKITSALCVCVCMLFDWSIKNAPWIHVSSVRGWKQWSVSCTEHSAYSGRGNELQEVLQPFNDTSTLKRSGVAYAHRLDRNFRHFQSFHAKIPTTFPMLNLFQCHFVNHRSNMDWLGIEHGPLR